MESLGELLAVRVLHGDLPGAAQDAALAPAASMSLALRLLRRLGAVEGDSYRPTPRGERMAALPVHPRLAALVEERDVLAASRVFGGGVPDLDHASDLLLRRFPTVTRPTRAF